MLLRLAMRNMMRSKRRTVLSTAAIVVGVMYLILGQAFVGGISEGIIQAAEDGLNGHVLVRAADYPTVGLNHPVDALVDLSADARTLLDEKAEAWTARTIFVSTLVVGDDGLRVRCIGVDSERDAAVFRRTVWKTEGAVPKGPDDGILIGAGLARLLGAKVGDRVVLRTRTHAGAINALDVPVAGLVNTGNVALDGTTAYMDQALAEKLVRTGKPTHIGIRLDHRRDAAAFAQALKPALGSTLETVTWEDETAELLRMQDIRSQSLNILVGVLLAMAAFAIANTIMMAAHERVGEVGTLRAMGMTKGRVVQLFIAEGAIMGTLSGALGGAIGGAGSWYLSRNPIDLAAMVENVDYGNMQFSSYLYLSFEPAAVALPIVIALLTAVVASIYPAFLASRLEIADAVRA